MTNKPQGKSSGTNGGSNGGSQHKTTDDIAELFLQLLQQTQAQTERKLTPDSAEAADFHNQLKASLETPEAKKELPQKSKWKLPMLNETAMPDQTAQTKYP